MKLRVKDKTYGLSIKQLTEREVR